MNVKAFFFVVWPLAAEAQGFAGLGASPEGFADPVRGAPFAFPEDHGAHPDFRIEWWYVTANLTAEDGTSFTTDEGERINFARGQVCVVYAKAP